MIRSYFPPQVAIDRYHRNKQGESIEEIAKRDGVTEITVKDSIRKVEIFRSRRSVDLMNEDIAGIVIDSGKAVNNALQEALTAENEYQDSKTGEKISVPDHSIRLQAASEVREFAKVIQPKVGPHSTVNVGVGISGGRVATGSYIGMEDRLREIRKTRAEQPLLEGRTVTATVLQTDGEEEDAGDEEAEE